MFSFSENDIMLINICSQVGTAAAMTIKERNQGDVRNIMKIFRCARARVFGRKEERKKNADAYYRD